MDQFQSMLDPALAKLKQQEDDVLETKRTINTICKWAGQPPQFADLEATTTQSAGGGGRKDRFYGQPLSTVVRLILEARQASDAGPASVNQIYEAMVGGGYKFETANEDNAKRSLRISLTKNTAIFHKIPSGDYGLKAWYPNVKESKAKESAVESEADKIVKSLGDEFDFEQKERAAADAAKSA